MPYILIAAAAIVTGLLYRFAPRQRDIVLVPIRTTRRRRKQ